MGEAKRRKSLDPNWGKQKVLIETTGVFLIDTVNSLDDLLIVYDATKFKVKAEICTWRETIEILDAINDVKNQNIDDFDNEDLDRKMALLTATLLTPQDEKKI